MFDLLFTLSIVSNLAADSTFSSVLPYVSCLFGISEVSIPDYWIMIAASFFNLVFLACDIESKCRISSENLAMLSYYTVEFFWRDLCGEIG